MAAFRQRFGARGGARVVEKDLTICGVARTIVLSICRRSLSNFLPQ